MTAAQAQFQKTSEKDFMRTTVLYHSADADGWFCREIARKFLPEAELIGWDFGDAKIPMPAEGVVYILDLSPDCVQFGFDPKTTEAEGRTTYKLDEFDSRLIWIDHHKSSIDKWPVAIPGYRIDGVAACRLAWQWFKSMPEHTTPNFAGRGVEETLPSKQAFIDRTVSEPLAVRLVGEHDVFDKRDPRAELFQHGLRSRDLEGWWEGMLSDEAKATLREVEEMIDKGEPVDFLPNGNVKINGLGERMVANLLKRGGPIQYARAQEYRDVITQQGFLLNWEGLQFLACNSHELDIRSQLFEAGIKPYHDALIGFTFTGKDYRVSLYRIPGKDVDILSIAKKYGGGGHVGACGFRAEKLPFLP